MCHMRKTRRSLPVYKSPPHLYLLPPNTKSNINFTDVWSFPRPRTTSYEPPGATLYCASIDATWF